MEKEKKKSNRKRKKRKKKWRMRRGGRWRGRRYIEGFFRSFEFFSFLLHKFGRALIGHA